MEILILSIFKCLAIISSIFVVNARNPVHAVFALILVFINAGFILFLLSFDFLALVLIVVYVGAIAVLFLFVVMMLNIKIIEIKTTALNYLPLSALLVYLFAILLSYFIYSTYPTYFNDIEIAQINYIAWVSNLDMADSIQSIGLVLFIFYPLSFIIVGIILLVAMMGAILLTVSHNNNIRRQVILEQNTRDFSKAIRLLHK